MCAICAPLLATMACGRDADTRGASSGATAAQVRVTDTLPGALDSAITKYTNRSLRSFASSLSAVNATPQNRCSAAPPGCNPWTRAQVRVYRGQKTVGPANVDGKGHGTIVMMMRNAGPSTDPTESRYGLRAGAYEYYMLSKAAGADMTWELYEVDLSQQDSTPRLHKSGTWHQCGDDHTAPTDAEGKFQKCPPPSSADSAAMAAAMLYDPRDPAWMTCSSGCCTANEQ